METYTISKSCTFFTTREKYGLFSNFHTGTPLTVGMLRFSTPEHLYQLCRFPSHPELQSLLNNQPTPRDCKSLVRVHELKTRPDWFHVRVPIMAWVVALKAGQHETFRDLLVSTGDVPIVEISTRDDFWGCKRVGPELVGENTLGKILMGVRGRLRQGSLGEVRPPKVPNMRLLGHELTGDRV